MPEQHVLLAVSTARRVEVLITADWMIKTINLKADVITSMKGPMTILACDAEVWKLYHWMIKQKTI